MASNVVPVRPGAQQIADPASGWWWNGSQWVCGDCDDGGGGPWFPPPATQPPWYPGANGGVSFGVNAPPNPIRGHFWWDGATLWLFDGAAWVNTEGGAVFPGGSGGGGSSGSVIISTNPPGNPVPGMQWWDGSVLRMWDGTSWQIIGPGQAAGPVPTTTHTFQLIQSTNVSIPTNTWGVVPLTSSPTIDPQLSYDSITHKIRPTKAGVYLWYVRAWLTASSGTEVGIGLMKNDTGIATGSDNWTVMAFFLEASPSPVYTWLQGGGISVMNGTTDTVRLFGLSSSGTFNGIPSVPTIDCYLLP